MLDLRVKIEESVNFVQHRVSIEPQIALILGTGLSVLADKIKEKIVIPYGEMPNFPEPTVTGHSGNLVIGNLAGKNVIAMQGRLHRYEGYVLKSVTLPVRIFKELGAEILIVTSAVGGLNRAFQAGDLMLITDHINLSGDNPLIGPNDDSLGPRFPDMSDAYDKELIKIAQEVARQEKIELQKGVYVGVSGPSYETPAEVRFLSMIGGDAVGMSTVPEVIVARHAGLRVLGIACVTDMALPEMVYKLTHEEVLAKAEEAGPRLCKLVEGIIQRIALS